MRTERQVVLNILAGLLGVAAAACSGGEAMQSAPSSGRGGAPGAQAVPVATAVVEEKAMPLDIGVIGSVEPTSTVVGARADDRRADRRQFQRGRRRAEGPGALPPRSAAARGRAAADRRPTWNATWRRPPTRRRRRSAIWISPHGASRRKSKSTRRAHPLSHSTPLSKQTEPPSRTRRSSCSTQPSPLPSRAEPAP